MERAHYNLIAFTKSSACIFLAMVVSLFTVAPAFADEPAAKQRTSVASYQDLQLFTYALTYLQRVSRDSSEQRKYLYTALQSMTEALDRYSYFVPPDLIGLFHETHKNKYVGVGIQIARSRDGAAIEITSVEDDSPAQRARLESGDIIRAINGKPTREMRLLDAVKLMRSPGYAEGSEITLSLLKAGSKNPSDVILSRAFIKPDVVSWKVHEKEFGYVKISRFNASTVEDFKKSVEEIKALSSKLKGVIIDLRNNPGGEIAASVELARLFVNEGIIATLTNRLEDVSTVYRANATRLYDWPLVVIVDKGTASAAELFAGALQIHKRAMLIGAKTFGKGVFQSLVPLASDSALYITLGPYYLSDGRSVEGVGITPDEILIQDTSEDVFIKKSMDILRSTK